LGAEHFRHEHYLCEDHGCLEKKFLVFPNEQELKQHVAREHGGNMSRAEKRQALTIPINFQVPVLCLLQRSTNVRNQIYM